VKNPIIIFISLLILAKTTSPQTQPIGFFDTADTLSNGCTGWTIDPDLSTQSLDVHFYIDGPAGQGQFAGSATANFPRPDVNVVTGYPGDHGFKWTVPAFFRKGYRKIYAYGIDATGDPNPQLSNSPRTFGMLPNPDSQISNVAGPSSIVLTTTSRLAGAIHSLTWLGQEFINSYDHGRQLQSACHFDGHGECYNPTEAGSSADGTGSTSTSFLQALSVSGNKLNTQTQMAFWTAAGGSAPGCGPAVNTQDLSNIIHRKEVTIGFQGFAHVIEYNVTFIIPLNESFYHGVFEALTGYMPPAFSDFYTYEPVTQTLTPLSVGPGEQGKPIIFSTPNQLHAMGIWSPDQPQVTGNGYGRWNFTAQQVVKWNCVFRENNIAPGTEFNYRQFVIVGSLTNVTVSMDQLYLYFFPPMSLSYAISNAIACAAIGSIDLTVAGGVSPFSFSWSNGATIEDPSNLAGGNYSVIVTDANGNTATTIATINQPQNLSLSLTASDALCNGCANGLVSSMVSGGRLPYSYLWSNGATSANLINVTAGNYFLSITDQDGCQVSASDTVNQPPPCQMPGNLSVSKVTTHSVRLHWDTVPGVHHYRIRGREVNATGWVYLMHGYSLPNFKNVNGLYNNRTYEWQIKSVCDQGGFNGSSWTTSNVFTTGCFEPNSSWTTNVGSNSATLNWSKVIGVAGYEIRGRNSGTSGWATILIGNANTTNKTVHSLMPSTQYEWSIRTWCNTSGIAKSSWMPLISFTTASLQRLGNEYEGSISENDRMARISVFPNPSTERVSLSWEVPDGDFSDLQMYNIQGVLVRSFIVGSKGSRILDLSTHEKGMYQVVLKWESGMLVKRLVVLPH